MDTMGEGFATKSQNTIPYYYLLLIVSPHKYAPPPEEGPDKMTIKLLYQ
jgi:hypothetical protein